MGRTARTFRNAIDIEESRWIPFRRALKPTQREYLDQVFEFARATADAGTMVTTPRITEIVLISSIMELLQEIRELRNRLERLEGANGEKGQA